MKSKIKAFVLALLVGMVLASCAGKKSCPAYGDANESNETEQTV